MRPSSIRALAAERTKLLAWTLLLSAFIVALASAAFSHGVLFGFAIQSSIVSFAVYLALVLVPALIWASDFWAGDGLRFKLNRLDYDQHLCGLFIVWSVCTLLYLAVRRSIAPPAWYADSLILPLILLTYTVLVVRELDFLSWPAALATVLTGVLTLPVAFILSSIFSFMPFFILIPLFYLGWQQLRSFFSQRRREASFGHHLHTLTINPRDSDAHYQIGLIHAERHRYSEAEAAFRKAAEIHPDDADYQYNLGAARLKLARAREAFDAFEKVYYKDPNYGFGDIKREIGKTYCMLDYFDEAEKFLGDFLEIREPDAEGRYWLACVYQKNGQVEKAHHQLEILSDRRRTFNEFRIRETRRWRREGQRLAKKGRGP